MMSEVAMAQYIPYVFNADNEAEKNNLLQFLLDNTPPLMRELLLSFRDPTGQGRRVVRAGTDACYINVQECLLFMSQHLSF